MADMNVLNDSGNRNLEVGAWSLHRELWIGWLKGLLFYFSTLTGIIPIQYLSVGPDVHLKALVVRRDTIWIALENFMSTGSTVANEYL